MSWRQGCRLPAQVGLQQVQSQLLQLLLLLLLIAPRPPALLTAQTMIAPTRNPSGCRAQATRQQSGPRVVVARLARMLRRLPRLLQDHLRHRPSRTDPTGCGSAYTAGKRQPHGGRWFAAFSPLWHACSAAAQFQWRR